MCATISFRFEDDICIETETLKTRVFATPGRIFPLTDVPDAQFLVTKSTSYSSYGNFSAYRTIVAASALRSSLKRLLAGLLVVTDNQDMHKHQLCSPKRSICHIDVTLLEPIYRI